MIFVGKSMESETKTGDYVRQGNTLEYMFLENFTADEDSLLTTCALPNNRCLYVACPDVSTIAVASEIGAHPCVRQTWSTNYHPHGDVEGLVRRFEIVQDTGRVMHSGADYLEIKKTTHLKGQPGRFKKFAKINY